MPSLARRTRVLLVLAAFGAALAAWQGAAAASLTVTGATLDGSDTTSTSSPPGRRAPRHGHRQAATARDWRATQYEFGSRRLLCANTDDGDSDGTSSRDFNVTAPGAPGDYEMNVYARSRTTAPGPRACPGAFPRP